MYSSTQAHAVKGSLEAFHSHAGAAILSAAFIPHPYKGSRTLPANTAPLGFPGHLLSLATSRRVLRVHSSLFLLSISGLDSKLTTHRVGGSFESYVNMRWTRKKNSQGFRKKLTRSNQTKEMIFCGGFFTLIGGYKGLGTPSL